MQVLLDTNIFLYAAGAAHPLREPCANILRRVADGSLDATINSQFRVGSVIDCVDSIGVKDAADQGPHVGVIVDHKNR